MITAAQAHITAVTNRIRELGLESAITSINEMIAEAASKGKFSIAIALYTREQKREFADIIKAGQPYLIYERPLAAPENEEEEEDTYEDDDDDFDDGDKEIISYEESANGRAIGDYYRLHGYSVNYPIRNFHRREPIDYTYHRSYESLYLDWDSDTVTVEEVFDTLRSMSQ